MNKRLIIKALGIIMRIMFIISIPVLCISMAINWEIMTPQVYTYGFEKYQVEDATGIYFDELEEIAGDFVKYFKSSEENIDITIMVEGELVPMFTTEEVIHFRDVKDLIRLNRKIMLVALCYFILSAIWWCRKSMMQAGKLIMVGAGLTLALLLILVIGITVNFNQLFLLLHTISFSNDFWSAPGYMLELFPLGFWYDVGLFTVLISSTLAVVFGCFGFGMVRLSRRKRSPLIQ